MTMGYDFKEGVQRGTTAYIEDYRVKCVMTAV